jgi:hypothetical protein
LKQPLSQDERWLRGVLPSAPSFIWHARNHIERYASASCLFQKQIRRIFAQNLDSAAQMARSLRARRARGCRPNAKARNRGQNQQTKKGQE